MKAINIKILIYLNIKIKRKLGFKNNKDSNYLIKAIYPKSL
jgi:hypothetical protein